nr:hypothetical protein [Mesorhizobium caraganae]
MPIARWKRHLDPPSSTKKSLHVLNWDSTAESIALREGNALGGKQFGLPARFHSFGGDRQIEVSTKINDHVDNGCGLMPLAVAGDEGPVNLQPSEGKSTQERQGRVSGAEIVDRNRNTQLPQGRKSLRRHRGVA